MMLGWPHSGVVSVLDAAWFAVLVLFVVRDLNQRPVPTACCSPSEPSAGC
jgi:hypothetical protein